MSHFSRFSNPDSNSHFSRDWGDGPVHIKFRSEKPKPKQSITKTDDAKAAEQEATA